MPIYFQGEETKEFGKESPKSKHAEDGRWLDNMEEIQDDFTTFYEKLYLSKTICRF